MFDNLIFSNKIGFILETSLFLSNDVLYRVLVSIEGKRGNKYTVFTLKKFATKCLGFIGLAQVGSMLYVQYCFYIRHLHRYCCIHIKRDQHALYAHKERAICTARALNALDALV